MNVHFQCVVQVCRSSCPEPQCGGAGPIALTTQNTDSYGAPQGPTLDTYGTPSGNPLQRLDINPRLPGGNTQRVFQTAGSNPQPSFLKSDGAEVSEPEPDKIVLTEPGYNNEFSKRSGLPTLSLGGKPRSLELDEEIDQTPSASRDSKSALKDVNSVDSSTGDDFEVHRRRRTVTDANGNRILRVVKRDATEMAEVETTERIIQVLAPNDIQEVSPPLDTVDDSNSENVDEVEINFDGSVDAVNSSLCVDTSAFVGVTVTFIMILVVALITIVFLWMRIKSLDTKTKRCF